MTENKRFRVVLIIGPPGSGKGSLGVMMAQRREFVHVSSGDVFRGLDPSSKEGQLFQAYAGQGALVPDEITLEIVIAHIKKLIQKNMYDPDNQQLLLDGFPRTRHQAQVMEKDFDVLKVILLEVNDLQILKNRIQGRAKQQGRLDDKCQDVLNQRFNAYEKQTKEVLSYYKQESVISVDAERDKEAVLQDVIELLNA